MTKLLKITGMQCEHCAMHVKEALQSLKEVQEVTVDLQKGIAEIKINADISFDILAKTISDSGYELVQVNDLL